MFSICVCVCVRHFWAPVSYMQHCEWMFCILRIHSDNFNGSEHPVSLSRCIFLILQIFFSRLVNFYSGVCLRYKFELINSSVDIISTSYRYYRYALAYRNINMYFEYRDIVRYFSENWIKSKQKKVERRNVKSKNQRPKFRQIFKKIG